MKNYIVKTCIYILAVASNFVNSIYHSHLHDDDIKSFDKFVLDFNKTYVSCDVKDLAFDNFRSNLRRIDTHVYEKAGYKIGINQFADMSISDFNKWKGDGCYNTLPTTKSCRIFQRQNEINIPSTIDWRDKNVVTPVKDQGQCGSCWAFSATGSIEGAWAIKTGELVSISEQQLVDCSASYGNQGCAGGLMDLAFEYAIDNGMCTEDEISYTGKDGSCKECINPTVKVTDCLDIQSGDQVALKEAVANGPVSIAIEADTLTFQLYTSGIISSTRCGTNLDHGVLIVGYGVEADGNMYWLVKNSWGSGWGDNGYVKIGRSESTNDNGICGIAMQPSMALC